jgi:hypothetical protein
MAGLRVGIRSRLPHMMNVAIADVGGVTDRAASLADGAVERVSSAIAASLRDWFLPVIRSRHISLTR